MSKNSFMHFFYVLLVITLAIDLSYESIEEERKVHIIYLGNLPEGEYLASLHHMNMLQTLGHDNNMADKILIRSYTRSFNGFAVNLTQEEVIKMKSFKGVVSIFKSEQFETQTTRSWDYMGFFLNDSRNPTLESDIIIGHLDSGVLVESESFSDHGLSDIPKKWKGVCHGGKKFVCNKKLIGARYYSLTDSSNYSDGHGTHTASTVAGNIVKNVSFFGLANGTARGGVPSSRIATYTVCFNTICLGHDILAAFDDAIADNVDVITISLGLKEIQNISDNVIAIGSFHAMQKNILTVNAAGNTGINGLGTVIAISPWLFTVAASADRKFVNKLILGNGHTILSTVVNSFDEINHSISLPYGNRFTKNCNESLARQCTRGCIDPHLVKGKIIVCDTLRLDVPITVALAGASGVILREHEQSKDSAFIAPIPTAILSKPDFGYVESYLKSKSLHTARITKSDIVDNDSPILASFSSKGPNTILPEIFKPDITASGISILAAYPPDILKTPPLKNYHKLRNKYFFLSGTSMACPHVAGAAAYVKSKHPSWSPSAIKSALMTTARNMNGKNNLNAELGHGAGQIDPIKAAYPGLVYETFVDDYFKMFCGLGSEGNKLKKIFGGNKMCPKTLRTYSKDLNYPAMTAPVHENSSFTVQFSRVVTNVGHTNSTTYHAKTSTEDSTISINVEPNILNFVHLKERKTFIVTVTGKWLKQDHISCSLIWFDGTYSVRSPILLYRSSIMN